MKLIYSARAASIIKKGGIGVLPTDTLYGIVGSALIPAAVEKIYVLRKRNKSKPMVVLISSFQDLAQFGIRLNAQTKRLSQRLWQHPVSIIFPCKNKKFYYLHRGKNSLAFRVPDHSTLKGFLKKTGPLVAPSANVESKPPAQTITQARAYFRDAVDFYIDDGKKKSKPSTLISIVQGKVIVRRKGAFQILNLTGDKYASQRV